MSGTWAQAAALVWAALGTSPSRLPAHPVLFMIPPSSGIPEKAFFLSLHMRSALALRGHPLLWVSGPQLGQTAPAAPDTKAQQDPTRPSDGGGKRTFSKFPQNATVRADEGSGLLWSQPAQAPCRRTPLRALKAGAGTGLPGFLNLWIDREIKLGGTGGVTNSLLFQPTHLSIKTFLTLGVKSP